MFINKFRVQSPNVKYNEESIESMYDYQTTDLVHENRDGNYEWVVKPKSVKYEFKTNTRLPKLRIMLVCWGGNNGSTLIEGVIAKQEGISWVMKDKVQQENYFGSLTQASTVRINLYNGEEIHAPFKSLLPMVDSNNIVFGGWDISNVGDNKRAMEKYTSEIFMGGKSTIVLHNTCEGSLLATPLILDLVLLTELSSRIELEKEGEAKFHSFHLMETILSYLTKSPLVPPGTPVVNALAK